MHTIKRFSAHVVKLAKEDKALPLAAYAVIAGVVLYAVARPIFYVTVG